MEQSVVAEDLGWRALPRAAQLYVGLVVACGAVVLAAWFPRSVEQPLVLASVIALASVTAAWKVNLPISLASGSTLSVSSAAKMMALLLLGPSHAVIVASAAALTQCTYKVKRKYPLYRTAFSVSAEVVAMAATGLVYLSLGGGSGPFDTAALARPLVGAIVTYFAVNTGLVAAAIALSTSRPLGRVWREDFLWSGVTFMVAGAVGGMAAVVVDRGYLWIALLLLAPIYVTYRTYQLVIGRIEDQREHMADMGRMHQETVDALSQAHQAERALAEEKERLAVMLAEKTRLEEVRNDLLEREHAARAAAEQANRLKDQFLAVVSHELRTPLNAILGWSEMLRSGRLDEAKRDRACNVIYESATRQAKLIDDLVDVARIMSGKLRLERTFVDLEDVVRSAVNVMQPTADAKRVQIGVSVESSIGAIYGDRARLQQVTWNLLSNAIKFTPEGGAVHMRVARSGAQVEIVVTDTGEGVPSDLLESIFEPFRQADGSSTRQHGGLGLGLSIVKHLVEAHGGVVGVESGGEGRGATFTVRLPIAPASMEQARVAMAQHPTQPKKWVDPPTLLDGLTVLVVDDDDEGRKVIAAQLEQHRAEVRTAASAAEALEMLQRDQVDVLLADIAMPEQDGYELIRKVRAMHPAPVASIPAAALTAFARNEDRLEALQAGFQLHLAKPVDSHTLLMAVARLGGKLPDRRQPRLLVAPGSVAVL